MKKKKEKFSVPCVWSRHLRFGFLAPLEWASRFFFKVSLSPSFLFCCCCFCCSFSCIFLFFCKVINKLGTSLALAHNVAVIVVFDVEFGEKFVMSIRNLTTRCLVRRKDLLLMFVHFTAQLLFYFIWICLANIFSSFRF